MHSQHDLAENQSFKTHGYVISDKDGTASERLQVVACDQLNFGFNNMLRQRRTLISNLPGLTLYNGQSVDTLQLNKGEMLSPDQVGINRNGRMVLVDYSAMEPDRMHDDISAQGEDGNLFDFDNDDTA